MENNKPHVIRPNWRLIAKDTGIQSENVLRRAGLPEDLLERERSALSTDEFFRLWQALEDEANDPVLALRIGEAMSAESFDPAMFAALCSANLAEALERLAVYKRLVIGKVIDIDFFDDGSLAVGCQWLGRKDAPATLILVELVFFVRLARIATREHICPVDVQSPFLPKAPSAFADYFGVPVVLGNVPQVRFSETDVRRPFLTANQGMWRFFDRPLRAQLAELESTASVGEKVHAALLKLLPGGGASLGAVAKKLGISTRTLHRRLGEENLSFQQVLNDTRQALATHYLKASPMSLAEIAFLLGYEDPNSFFRAFNAWTGTTPESVRRGDAKKPSR